MGWLKDYWYWPKKHKDYAGEYWSQAAGRAYDKGQRLMNQPGAANQLLGVLSKSDALAYYGAAAATDLASDSLGGWALDLASMGKGKYLSMGAAGAAKLLARAATPGGAAAKVLATATDLARQWSDSAAALLLARKAVKLGSTASRAIHGPGGGQPAVSDLVPGWKPPYREPFRQVSLDIHPQLPRARPRPQPVQRRRPRWSASYVDPVKLAAAQLMEPRPGSLRWMAQGLNDQSTSRPYHRDRPAWGQEATRARPFDWRRGAIPPPDLQRTYRPDRPGEAGWGLEVTRSRPSMPQPGSAAWMAQSLR